MLRSDSVPTTARWGKPLSGLSFGGWLVGWVLLQAGALVAQQEYLGDGEPTAYEEEVRWLVNRARFDRNRENALRGTSYTDIPLTAGPLAPNARLTQAARRHCEDLARKNRFQHETVVGSLFYNAKTHPQPWHRMTVEGYDWDLAGENIAAGYLSAASVYVGWWKSGGHRKILGDRHFCEVGNGYFYRSSSEYRHYQGMSLGRSWEKRFFTGTLFQDRNNNKAYSRGEGVAGVRVDLAVGAVMHPDYDVSTRAGSFALPLEGIPEGAVVQVRLTNTTAQRVALSVPRSFHQLEDISLEPGESVGWGGFVRQPTLRNYGFRDAVIPAASLGLTPGSRGHEAEGTTGASVVVAAPEPVKWAARSEAAWVTVLGGGEGMEGESLAYAVAANPLGEERTTRILFEVEGLVQGTFVVRQAGVAPELGLEEGPAQVAAAGETLNLAVSGNVTWAVSTELHWLKVEGRPNGQAAGVVVLKVANNAGSLPRVGRVTLSGAGLERQIEIRQAAGSERSVAERVALEVGEGAGQVIGVSGLPAGLQWDAATQQVTGFLSQAGTVRLRVRVRAEDGRVTQHEVVLQVRPLEASYVGRFEARVEATPGHPVAEMGGLIKWTVAATGGVTGTVELADRRRAVRGRLVVQPGMAPTLQLAWDGGRATAAEVALVFAENHLVTGQLKAGEVMAEVAGWRQLWQAQTHPIAAVRVGRAHVVMDLAEAWQSDVAVPQGAGYLVVTVGWDGGARWVGRLGDGTSLTGAGFLGPASQWQGWQARYGRRGVIRWFGVWDNEMGLRCGGEWEKTGPSHAGDRLYREGFGRDERGAVGLLMEGSKWVPEQMVAALEVNVGEGDGPTWVLRFAEGVLRDTAEPLTMRPVTVQAGRRAELPPPGTPLNRERLNLRFNERTGMVTGGFRLEDAHPFVPGGVIRREVTFQGLWLNPARYAAGYFVGVRLPEAPGALRPQVSGLVVVEPDSASGGAGR